MIRAGGQEVDWKGVGYPVSIASLFLGAIAWTGRTIPAAPSLILEMATSILGMACR